jgi:hypothetical protein
LPVLAMTAVTLVAVLTIGAVGLGLTQVKRPAPVHLQAAVLAPLTVKAALDAEVTLPSGGGTRMSTLARLIHEQLSVYVAYPYCSWSGVSPYLDFVPFKPGRHKLRDVVAMVTAAGRLTFEAQTDGEIVALYFWHKPDAPLLAEMLKLARSADALERCTGARWLQDVHGRDALVQLLTMLQDPNARVRHFAARAIVKGWPGFARTAPLSFVAPQGTVAAVARGIEDDEWRETQRNMETLPRRLRAPEVFFPIYKKRWKHAAQVDPDVLARAPSGSFGLPGGKEGRDAEADLFALLDELPDPNSAWAMRALAWLDTDAAIARISKQLDVALENGERKRVERILASSLLQTDSPASVRELTRILRYFDVRKQAEAAVVKNPGDRDEAEVRALKEALFITGQRVRWVVEKLTKFDTPEARAVCLARFRAARDYRERCRMANLMVRSQPAVREILFAELAQGGGVALRAARLLRSTNDPQLVPFFIRIIGMNDGELHAVGMIGMDGWSATSALGEIGGPEAEKVLIALAQTETVDSRRALWALGMMKMNSPAASRALKAAVLDADGNIREAARSGLHKKLHVDDLDALLTSAQMERPEDVWGIMYQSKWNIWAGVAAIGGGRAARGLADATAKGNPLAAMALVHSRETHCLQVVRDVFAGNDAKMKRQLMDAVFPAGELLFANGRVCPPGAYYAVRAVLDELPRVDAKRKLAYVAMLGWTCDPRAVDALGKLLVDLDEPVAVRRAAAVAVQDVNGPMGRDTTNTNADPAAVEPTRHAFENDPDDIVRREARLSLIKWKLIPADQANAPLPPGKFVPPVPVPVPNRLPPERQFPPFPDPPAEIPG